MNDLITNFDITEKTTFYTLLEKTSKDKTKRLLKTFIIHNNRIIDITKEIANITNKKIINGCILACGCGLDVGYDLIYRLFYKVFNKSMAYHNQKWLN